MAGDDSRRFTDKEVALVLRKASEMEEVEGTGGGGGLTLRELEQIAGEVGISPALVRRAVGELDTRASAGLFAEAPRVQQVIRAVGGELDAHATARLFQHVEGSSDHVGVVTQALGTTQWTAQDRFRTTQVSITPAKGETRVRVVERATSRLWRLVHVVPTTTAVALVLGTIGQFDPSSGAVAAFAAVGGVAGAAAGRLIWSRLAAASKARVGRLAAELAGEAEVALDQARNEAEAAPAGDPGKA